MPGAGLSKLRSRGRTFAGDRSGATAVEFALVALPLIAMLFAIVELALLFLLSSTLDNATADIARTVRTGQAQAGANNNASTMVASICGKLGWLQAQCTQNLHVDVRTYNNWTSPTAPNPIKNGAFDPSALQYDTGVADSIVIVRAYYQWKVLTPFLAGGLQPLNDGTTVITATAAFKNEPFS